MTDNQMLPAGTGPGLRGRLATLGMLQLLNAALLALLAGFGIMIAQRHDIGLALMMAGSGGAAGLLIVSAGAWLARAAVVGDRVERHRTQRALKTCGTGRVVAFAAAGGALLTGLFIAVGGNDFIADLALSAGSAAPALLVGASAGTVIRTVRRVLTTAAGPHYDQPTAGPATRFPRIGRDG